MRQARGCEPAPHVISILEASLGLNVIQNLLKLLILKTSLQATQKGKSEGAQKVTIRGHLRFHTNKSDLGISALASSAASGHRLARLASSNLWSFFCRSKL